MKVEVDDLFTMTESAVLNSMSSTDNCSSESFESPKQSSSLNNLNVTPSNNQQEASSSFNFDLPNLYVPSAFNVEQKANSNEYERYLQEQAVNYCFQPMYNTNCYSPMEKKEEVEGDSNNYNCQVTKYAKSSSNSASQKKSGRTRHPERTVSQVLELLEQWRLLQPGDKIKRGKKTANQSSLTEIAKQLGVPRKSLDDYMRIVKHAKVSGFDFSAHLNDKFGVVRTHVNKVRSQSKDSLASLDQMEELGQKPLFGIELSKNSKKIN